MSIFVKMFKNLLFRNHMEDEAETWHTCLGYYSLQNLCFLFRSDKNFVCYGNLKVSIDLLWKKWKLTISVKSLGIFDIFLQKCLLRGPPCFIRSLSKLLYLIG